MGVWPTPITLSLTWVWRLLPCLLLVDGLFILAHLLTLHTDWLTAAGFGLDKDAGYGEWWQYLKLAGGIGLLWLLLRRQRAPLYLHWLLLFLYLLLDDALMLHEKGGRWLATVLGLNGGWGLRPRDWGELIIYLLTGLFFLMSFTLTYGASERPARTFAQRLLLWLIAFVAAAVGLDMVQEIMGGSAAAAWLLLAEDGGELLIMSFIIAAIWQQTQAVYQWPQAQVQAWVQPAVTAIGLMVLFTSLFAWVQYATPGLIGNDGYYHAKMGLLMRQEGLTPTPPQLPFTILNPTDFYNHHLLYHLYLAWFATVDPAQDGGVALTAQMKLASLFLPALAFLSIWWLLRQQKIPWAAAWTVALFALSGPFLYRLSMTRAQSASLLILVIALHCLLQGKYRWLLPLGFIYVWLYNGFPLLWLLVGVYGAAAFLVERRWAWQPAAYATIGILLGLLINPYFPQNVTFIYYHLLPKVGTLTIPVGNEWYPYDTWQLVQHSGWSLLALAGGVLAWAGQSRPLDKRTLLLFLLVLAFGGMLLKSRRFIEYFPAFVLIFTAFSLSPVLERWRQRQPAMRQWLPLLWGLLLLLPLYLTLGQARASVTASAPADKYAAASLWLKGYAPPGSTVFQLDWDDFPRLFFYDSDKQYTVGLDPTYMALFDPDLYQEWVRITRGELTAPSQVIRERFGGIYVFSDLEHGAFWRVAAADPGLQEIYRDEHAVIFLVAAP